jgi:hypothetical protein
LTVSTLRRTLFRVQQFADTYALATEPQAIAAALIKVLPEFAHLELARIAFVFSERALVLRGTPARAVIQQPAVQGFLRPLFEWFVANLTEPLFGREEPDFLVLVDRALWSGDVEIRREHLVYHELCHIKAVETEFGVPKLGEDGRPRLRLVSHDNETFHSEIRRYGVEVCDLGDHILAIVDGEKAARERNQRDAGAA